MVLMEGKGDASVTPVRTSDRLRQRPKYYARGYMYYKPGMRKKVKSKKRTAASQIAKKLLRKPAARAPLTDSIAANLRRSTRKRRISVNLEGYDTDSSSMEDDDLMRPRYRSSKSKGENNAGHDEVSARPKRQKLSNSIPRREGLRPRRSLRGQRLHTYQQSEDEQESSEEQGAEDQTENGNDIDEDVGDEEEVDGGDEAEADGDDEDGEEEQEGRRRYDLRDRSEVRRPSPRKEGKHRPQSPRRVLVHGIGPKNSKYLKKGGSRMHKRSRFSLPDDSDDSLLVDEPDEGPSMPWMRSGRGGMPWLLGGLDMHSPAAWGMNVGASGWGHQGDSSSLTPGVQTAGPSSKGGADIQPLQVDESVSFNDIGGLSEYIDALKEMVFFPLLYPDFFANYHITPPRGVLLCGPPGTGKTLIARALACAASKAGQKVSFYMRKGADVLSKWVGEAERQLKLLFEEAQKNQPSIIFFDEIDGLAPVRSSKQEQIHNSIVSTLLALMDGLDSRGQVVLIGATNRIDAIDGALRRPGRFDREFYFPLPGYEARAEILDIHTRKWKDPPPKELKMELAASCVGYCGADLKALCTEAAIRAFREKYPQVYTSDDKFVIDVDSVRVEKYHFLEAMSTITPAAHRGSIVHSRPLSSVIAPCLKRHLEKIMERISDIFPFLSSIDVSKFSALTYGSSIPLVYRPRLLICGGESVGLDHVGPAVLHELEKFSVHSLGLPSLLSDPSAKTPEEALVHIFGEAKRTTPSILYLSQFHLWWDTAHEQLRAVLLTLLNELPSNLPVLLLGTSSVDFTDLEQECAFIFSSRNVYQVDQPSYDDRLSYFNLLFESLLSLQTEESRSKSKKQKSAIDLPKAPKEVEGPKASELKAKAEAEQHAVRRMRMCLRDICNRILYNKRFNVFHFPVSEEEVPDYRSVVHNPMDMATVLQRVDSGQYLTRATFMKDVDLIVSNAKTYNGDDYNGSRIVSRACELRDVVHGMLSQMDPSLVSFCDKIASQGGPLQVVDDEDSSILQAAPVAQLVSVPRMSARLRNVQPDVNLSQSYEVLKRQKRSAENEQGMNKDETSRDEKSPEDEDLSKPTSPEEAPKEPDSNGTLKETDTSAAEAPEPPPEPMETDNGEIAITTTGDDLLGQLDTVKQRFMELTAGYGVPQLERLYSRIMKGVIELTGKESNEDHRQLVIRYLLTFVENSDNF
ncbi:ATPase family AAA domain-containing protein At1g05910-like isoform X1 [Phragmites australis]|uniref:ATPase family AAA domain-containing protein At1g05910-like isoform X1 n=2 Tax=Phragmites australis TaxID=29695 RepID=UPI002D788FFB|nr:ATPase family AAA domain-containing protein At1g05910-like isoform X1 [Phragmites australis]XP_062193341.1 ATPase family AAA domain-containing protein At1g05910-like isoform X1 [Phragmites australis]